MANKFSLKIVTPDGKAIKDQVDILNVYTTSGALGILANHLPLVAVLEISHLNYKKDGASYDFAISGGIVNVRKDGVIVLAETFEAKDEIDKSRAEASKKRAEDRLAATNEDIDTKRAELALRRALNRLSF